MPESPASPLPRQIAFLTFPEAQSLDVVGPLEVFATADALHRRAGGESIYHTEVCAPEAGLVRMASGLQMVADRAIGEVTGPLDTLFVGGGDVRPWLEDQDLLQALRHLAPRARRIASVCTGAFLLAEAGLLDGHRATTHWAVTRHLEKRYPQVEVEADAIYVDNGDIFTSAGATAGMDLAIALVEADLGHRLAMEVARYLVLFLRRPGGQSQFSSQLAAQSADAGPLDELLDWLLEHLDQPLTVESLADRAAMSPRHFARVFAERIGETPGRFVQRARIDRARRLLEQGSDSHETVAKRCGLGNAERLRKTFHRHLGIHPREYRHRFPGVR